jgi:sigma-B regulation protein RsbU (phosphoserine phosphatase)
MNIKKNRNAKSTKYFPEGYSRNTEGEYSERNLAWARERAEKDETFLSIVLDSLPYPFYVIDVSNYAVIAANSAAQFGRLKDSTTCHKLTHNSDTPCAAEFHPCPIESIKETKQPLTIEHLHYDNNKNPMNVEIHAFPVFDRKGNVSHIIEYVLDITARKQTDNSLRWELSVNSALSELYAPLITPKASIETIANIVLEQAKILTQSEHGYVSTVNQTAGDNVAHTLMDMLNDQCMVYGENRKFVFARGKDGRYSSLLGHSLNTREAFYTNSPTKHLSSTGIPEGHIPIHRFLSVPVLLAEELVGQISLANKREDYTDRELNAILRLSEFYALAIQRKRAEDEIRQSEERFNQVAETAEEWIWEVDATGFYTYSNTVVEKILGWKPDEIVGKKYFYDFFIPESREQLKTAAFKVFSKKDSFRGFINSNHHKNGNTVFLKTSGLPILDESGNLLGYRGVDTDITDRKLAEEALQKAHKKLNDDLTEAVNYVKSILPSPFAKGGIRTDWRFIPSRSLGGDAFGYYWLGDYFLVYLIDVSGHGVGPALLSVSVMNALRTQSLPDTDFKDPESVLNSLNISFPSEKNNDMFFTIWYGVYNMNTRELSFASGGHPPALLLNKNAKDSFRTVELQTPNFVVGGIPEVTYQKKKHRIDEGSTLYILSDGVYEIKQPDGSMWRFGEFSEFMSKLKTEDGSRLDRLFRYANNIRKTDSFEDDFTVIEVAFG